MVEKQKVLIVDDDNNIAELISLYFTKECFDTKIVNKKVKYFSIPILYMGQSILKTWRYVITIIIISCGKIC